MSRVVGMQIGEHRKRGVFPMKKRILAAILGLCMLALSLTGCGNAPDVESGAAAQD